MGFVKEEVTMDKKDVDKADIGQIHRSLKNSKVRDKIYNHLCDISPKGATPDELSELFRSTPTNVSGALNGDGERFSETDALVQIGVVRCDRFESHGHTFEVYYATPYGLEVKDRVKVYKHRSSLFEIGVSKLKKVNKLWKKQ